MPSTRCARLKPYLSAAARDASSKRAGAVVDARRIAGGDRAVRLETALSASPAPQSGVGARLSSGSTTTRIALLLRGA